MRITALFPVLAVAASLGVVRPAEAQRSAPHDFAQDMKMKITGPFTFAAVSDVIIVRPYANSDDAGLQSALRILQGADAAFGNFESIIRDERTFTGPLGGSMTGTREVAPDLVKQGFDIMGRAGNHLKDAGDEGMFETMRLLNQAGLQFAGAGRNLNEARAPRFAEVPKGRIGLVAMYSQAPGGSLAGTPDGFTGGRPGLNPLGVTSTITVRPQDVEAMRAAKAAVWARRTDEQHAYDAPAADPAGMVALFGDNYKAGAKPGEITYSMNAGDLKGNLNAIKNGKEYADFMVAAIHAHQSDNILQRFLFEDRPPAFLVDLAHQAIDNGADAFVGSGPHTLRGIEIYKGKPIFYDLGEFAREWDWNCDCNNSPNADMTQAESVMGGLAARGVVDAINYESAIAVSKFDGGVLREVRIYPIWAREDGVLSKRGMPMTAPPEIAQRILKRLQDLSKPLGTTITIEGNEGVIRVGGAAGTTNNNN